jgi:hypothetical protein
MTYFMTAKFYIFLSLLLFLTNCSILQKKSIPDSKLLDKHEIKIWLDKNLKLESDSQTLINIKFEIIEIGIEVWKIGSKLTNNDKSYLIRRTGKQFRITEISDKQASNKEFDPYMIKRVRRFTY